MSNTFNFVCLLQYEGSPFCGREIPRNFTTNEDVTIVFITDDNISNHSGFLIRWEVINGIKILLL